MHSYPTPSYSRHVFMTLYFLFFFFIRHFHTKIREYFKKNILPTYSATAIRICLVILCTLIRKKKKHRSPLTFYAISRKFSKIKTNVHYRLVNLVVIRRRLRNSRFSQYNLKYRNIYEKEYPMYFFRGHTIGIIVLNFNRMRKRSPVFSVNIFTVEIIVIRYSKTQENRSVSASAERPLKFPNPTAGSDGSGFPKRMHTYTRRLDRVKFGSRLTVRETII